MSPYTVRLVEVPIIEMNEPESTEKDKGMRTWDADSPLARAQSLTTGKRIATKGVLLKKIERQKQVM
jgi:hypothetical protein